MGPRVIRFFRRWLRRLGLALLLLVLVLLAPVAWVETLCRPTLVPSAYPPILTDPAEHRVEAHDMDLEPLRHV